jgi:hypothetical protein
MEQETARILQRSSDAVVIIRLTDETVVGINEAFFAVTGHPQHELMGRDAGELFASLEMASGRSADALPTWASSTIGLWTRSGELRRGHLSALSIDVDGQPHAVCSIRELKDPAPAERRLAARERVTRVVRRGGPPLEVARSAIQALAESLRWEFGALWLEAPASRMLRCAVVWRSALAELGPLEEASWRSEVRPGAGLVGRSWRDRQAVWASDAMTEPDRQRLGQAGDLVHGWFGFPVRAGGQVIGVVEFFSCEVRHPDRELLQMTNQLGELLGSLFGDGAGRTEPTAETPPDETPAAVSIVLRDLEDTVATMASASEGRRNDPAGGSPELLRALAASIGRLDRLLEGTVEPQAGGAAGRPSAVPAPSAAPLPRIPTGLTLKAVSLRTGIPAATLRTWERRYQFLRPERSASGYRLYGEQEIERILQVKSLLEQGVRIGEAMETVRRGPDRRRAIG